MSGVSQYLLAGVGMVNALIATGSCLACSTDGIINFDQGDGQEIPEGIRIR